ncbi:transcription antitermination factor NusB [bacterium]|nr:transcription antitermination factor NusB [bacterium]
MGLRRQARGVVLQGLFMCDALADYSPECYDLYLSHFEVPAQALEYSKSLGLGILKNITAIDTEISCSSEHWSLNRMSRVDRNILRIATYEMLYCNDISPQISIDEAIEIAKRYGSEHSPNFVNGVLDQTAARLSRRTETVDDSIPATGTTGR